MSFISRNSANLKRFTADTGGNVAILFGLAAIPFLLAAGGAIDFTRQLNSKTMLQNALDAGSLAAASLQGVDDAERIKVGKKTFDINMAHGARDFMNASVNFQIIDGKVVSDASLEVKTSLLVLAGYETLPAKARAEVALPQDKKAEIALVLDYSYSMTESVGGQVKYEAMKEAAQKLIKDLEKANPDKVKFSLVPFSHHVYTTLPRAFVTNADGITTPTWTGCTQDRQGPYNLTNETPASGIEESKWNQEQAPDHIAYGCDGYTKNNLATLTLTNDFDLLTSRLEIMKPYAYTHIALGAEFGYHMLSPSAPYEQGADFSDKNVRKFMVLLTDGAQTEPGFGPSGARDVAAAEENLEQICSNAKSDGITIITMAFDLDDSDTRQRLEGCATNPDEHFFVADGSADISKAFEAVKAAVTAEIYVSK
jgi:Flp pilus assembly protein TadG